MELSRKNLCRAFTLVELLLIIAVMIVLAVVLLPDLARPRHHHGMNWNCVNNLKQIGIAFRTWSLDNSDKYPMHVSVINGGTMELINSGAIFPHFLAMSNELSTPKLLVCPQETDPRRRSATTFADGPSSGAVGQIPLTNDNQVSYFVGVDADETHPQMLLCGDRNLTNWPLPTNRLLMLTSNSAPVWTHELHNGKGNVALADGGVFTFDTRGLIAQLRKCAATNRLAMP